jgi:hypothetical protein
MTSIGPQVFPAGVRVSCTAVSLPVVAECNLGQVAVAVSPWKLEWAVRAWNITVCLATMQLCTNAMGVPLPC